jgi:hypothetical protein
LETTLYLPVKRFLEKLGFEVKGEIRGCDVVGPKGDSPPVIVVTELKLRFNLELVLQGVDRTPACDEIWLAVRSTTRGRERDPRVRKLCRLLGFGLLGVRREEGLRFWSSRLAGGRGVIRSGARSSLTSTAVARVIP